jgi:hypothetical protein
MWLRPPASPEQENAWQVAGGLLGLMAEDAINHKAEFWLSVIGPEIEDNPNPEAKAKFLKAQGLAGFDYSEKRLQLIAETRGIEFISLEAQLSEYTERNHQSIRGFFNTRPDYGHWNENGNSVAASIVADRLSRSHTRANLNDRSMQNSVAHPQGGS